MVKLLKNVDFQCLSALRFSKSGAHNTQPQYKVNKKFYYLKRLIDSSFAITAKEKLLRKNHLIFIELKINHY
ncbi:hypothetical protein AYY19_16010 [Photobacterium aquimaris]|uniref:Uncharacterized protein n=1 Tax=Photobacterium aquimaris TaxID=512643 RepID=A0A2T3IHA8_9GAMM|nr:hypothetical protein AYY19_16010 [Photobacterium aquimaris]OBU21105.1 hypothetical protein AYY20_14815 [Photobacterium aquimaris]PSU26970.1 hypothetical protein CTM88_15100 [Photobacterium aquimaris]PSV98468.1 hypothetical protein CTM91_16520 [Photobacterium aquimaris]